MKCVAAFSIAILICLHLVSNVHSIRCFQCNSVNNSGCVNLENYRRHLFVPKICDDFNGAEAFCRKTVIQVMEKGKQHEPRVIRSCGYVAHKNPCYRADNEGHYEQVCQCFEDGCNGAGRLSANFIFLILFSSVIIILRNKYMV